MRLSKKLNKYERAEMQKKKLEFVLKGQGRYVYRNVTNGELTLPKDPLTGSRRVGPKETFEGDDYFMGMVNNSRELSVVAVLEHPQSQGVQVMNENKLILDQPPTVTTGGTIEHIVQDDTNRAFAPKVAPKPKALNEKPVETGEILLNENPLDGVEILIG